MKQLEITFGTSEPKVDLLELEKQKHVHVRKPVALHGQDGRLLGTSQRTKEQIIEDFWKRVKRGKDDECWEWQAGYNGNTPLTCYGVMWGLMGGNGKRINSLEGPIQNGLLICHTCDNPKCVNPNHLFAGTNKDNVDDSFRKGRANRECGEDRYNSKLTEEDVREIRRRYVKRSLVNGGAALAKEFGVWKTMIHAIVTHKRWKHVN